MGRPIQNLCFPRSGHGVLRRALGAYYGDAFRCAEITAGGDGRGAWYLKNHDFSLRAPVHPTGRYLVQIRFPLPSLTSWFLFDEKRYGGEVGYGDRLRSLLLHRCLRNTVPAVYYGRYPRERAHWARVARIRMAFWVGFYRKWVLSPIPDRLVVDYDRLVAEPERAVGRVVRWLEGRSPDPGRVAEACRRAGIRPARPVEPFRYFDGSFLVSLSEPLRDLPGVAVDEGRLRLPEDPGA